MTDIPKRKLLKCRKEPSDNEFVWWFFLFKDNAQGNDIYEQMTFYREMAKKYGTRLYKSVSNEIPGEVIYEDDFQIAVKNIRDDIEFKTEEVG